MRKDSAIILSVSVLLTAGIIGGAHFLATRNAAASISGKPEAESVRASDFEPALGSADVSAETPYARTHQIIECHDPEMGTFYTNAAGCEGADLENRLSDYQTLRASPIASHSKRASSSSSKAGNQQRTRQKPNLRLTGRSPPSGLPPECKFPVGKALEIERPLSAAGDPYQSIWRVDYCRWRCEAMRERCPISNDLFDFSYGRMCRGTEYEGCLFWISSRD